VRRTVLGPKRDPTPETSPRQQSAGSGQYAHFAARPQRIFDDDLRLRSEDVTTGLLTAREIEKGVPGDVKYQDILYRLSAQGQEVQPDDQPAQMLSDGHQMYNSAC